MNDNQTWVDIPGYNGCYQINRAGDVRAIGFPTYRYKEPRMRRINVSKDGYKSILLTDECGQHRRHSIARLVAEIFLDGCDNRHIPYPINGDKSDTRVENIGLRTRGNELWKTASRAVAKTDHAGNIIEVYPSVSAAARENYRSVTAIVDRCKNRIQKVEEFKYKYLTKEEMLEWQQRNKL